MEQIAEIQAPASQDQVKVLTELVQQLLRKNERNQEPEDPHFITRIPVTDLTAYPELTEAFPSIEEDFFRSPLAEEEHNNAIYSCPRTSSMNYNPPPLNDSASTAVMKSDTALYGNKVALAQATRPIDYFVHRRIQYNPGLDTSEDPEVMFASTMRALLSKTYTARRTRYQTTDGSRGVGRPHCQETSSIASTCPALSQAPAELEQQEFDQHQHCRDPEQPPSRETPCYVQIGMFQTNEQPMGSEHSGEGILNPLKEPPLSRSGIEVVRYENSGEGPLQVSRPQMPLLTPHPHRQESHRRDTAQGSRLLQPAAHGPEKYWRPHTSLRPPQAQPTCGGAELQDRDPVFHLPHAPQNRLFDVPRRTGCIHAYPGI
ncbi:hypothetical protein AYI70_g7025 [Smittium culicis]|uniref:Uncharacterized protein n=1 Tax=Smittium culicis TaxID=133412 RepID=A0A1R1XMC4_9FUNG|nr:hypothetical protein AYI70_g7025 [Smittium culicis]